MTIYIGNLPYEVNEDELRQAFLQFGQVESVTVVKDRFSGKSKGYGFVEMATKAEGDAAIKGLRDFKMKGRALNVNEARSRLNNRPPVNRSYMEHQQNPV